MKYYIVFILSLFAISNLVADEHYISLEKFKLNLDSLEFYIEDIIDVRQEKQCIGFVQKGINRQKIPAYFNKGIKEEFKGLLSKSLSRNNNSQPLIIRINKLFIYEVTYLDKEVAIAELNISFITKKNTVYYEIFMGGTAVEKYGIDVTNSHGKNIKKAIEKCFNQFNERIREGKIKEKMLTLKELYINPLHNIKFEIITADNYKKGIFKTYFDFINNTPDTTKDFSIKYRKSSDKEASKAVPIWNYDNSKIVRIWGFSDGKKIFKNINNVYYALVKKNENFILYAYPPDAYPLDFGSTAYLGAMMGGLIGALLFTAIEAATTKKIKYKIDYSTGMLSLFNKPIYKTIEARIYFCSSDYNTKGEELRLYIDDQLLCTLKRGTYYIMRTYPPVKSNKVCIKSEYEEICQEITPKLFNTEMYLIRSKKKSKLKLNLLNPNMKSSIFEDIRKEYIKEVCIN